MALLARGIELKTYGAVLGTWPRRAWHDGLFDDERAFIRTNRVELRAMWLAGLPETTVKWDGGLPAVSALVAADTTATEMTAPPPPTTTPKSESPVGCHGCGRSPCIGSDHWAFATLHPDHPSVVERQHREYLEHMTASLRRERMR